MRVLALGTFPSARPLHGGQRRVRAIAQAYARAGVPYLHAAIYTDADFKESERGADDFVVRRFTPKFPKVALIQDVEMGEMAATSRDVHKHLLRLIKKFAPTHIELEHPFLFPLVEWLTSQPQFESVPIIYSSHNIEAPFKREMLEQFDVSEKSIAEIEALIWRYEKGLAACARKIFCVSEDDLAIYKRLSATEVTICRNGIDLTPAPESLRQQVRERFDGRRFLAVIGGGNPPNATGFCKLMLGPGLAYLPPEPSIAVCGAMGKQIFEERSYQTCQYTNANRIVFYDEPNDETLSAIKSEAHGFLLPITYGGGSNLKTAEAIVSGKYVIATSIAMRGFSEFRAARGVTIADDGATFRRAAKACLGMEPLVLSEEERKLRRQVLWEHTLLPLEEWAREEKERVRAGKNANAA